MQPKIKILIVDDSIVIQKLLSRIFSKDSELEVVAVAEDAYMAREKIFELEPDIMVLDVTLPKMDGITFLEKVMQHHPIRTIILSALTQEGSEAAMRAYEAGAIDVLEKPAVKQGESLDRLSHELIDKVKAIAKSPMPEKKIETPKSTEINAFQKAKITGESTDKIIAIASSTGGTEALKEVLPGLPKDVPGIVIVQHMPPVFTKTYAEKLNALCPFEVREAKDGDRIRSGLALLAPGNYHMEIVKTGTYFFVKLHQGPMLHSVRPAADYLMKSVAKYAKEKSIGVVLTGMGKDGAAGLLEMKKAGSFNIAQDEASCVVYGMPKHAVDCNAVDVIKPLSQIADTIMKKMKMKISA